MRLGYVIPYTKTYIWFQNDDTHTALFPMPNCVAVAIKSRIFISIVIEVVLFLDSLQQSSSSDTSILSSCSSEWSHFGNSLRCDSYFFLLTKRRLILSALSPNKFSLFFSFGFLPCQWNQKQTISVSLVDKRKIPILIPGSCFHKGVRL